MKYKNIIWGVILIIIGTMFLIEEFIDFNFDRFFWPIILIASGLMLLLKYFLRSKDFNNTNN